MIRYLLQLLVARWSAPDDRVVLDQAAYYDGLREAARKRVEMQEAIDRDRYRQAQAVGAWARETAELRGRAPLPPCVARRDIGRWLPGLFADEVVALANGSTFEVLYHLFDDDPDNKIDGVRSVQPLPQSVLRFPNPVLEPIDPLGRGAGGGPRPVKVRG